MPETATPPAASVPALLRRHFARPRRFRGSSDELTKQGRAAGAHLKMFRKASNRSAVFLADRMGVSPAAYYRYEAGFVVKLATVHLIAELLGMTFAQVVVPPATRRG